MLFTDEELLDTGEGCLACKLYRTCKSPRMRPEGKGKKGILLVSDCPGASDDEFGEPLSGERGMLLQKILFDNGIDMNRDCRKMNAVACRPPKGREPNEREITCCRSMVWREIFENPPKVVILLGDAALRSVIGFRWKRRLDGISKWRGFSFPDAKVGCWVCPTYSVSHLLRFEKDRPLHLIFGKDIKKALRQRKHPIPTTAGQLPFISIFKGKKRIDYLRFLLDKKPVTAFDYETTGLKPYEPGHKIVSVSFSTDGKEGAAMLVTPDIIPSLRMFLRDSKIRKIASNMKFESTWSKVILGVEPRGWHWDTMLWSHVEDNRSGITSLKFQTYRLFGVPDYDSEVAPYLDSHGESFNRIEECPESLLLEYNGVDSVFEWRMADLQQESRANVLV